MNRDYDPRILQLAFKGWKDINKANFLADEELVVSAVVTAITTGRTTTILTRDTDVFDQFVKLHELIVADYACFRFGEVYFHNPDWPRMPTLETRECKIENGFTGDEIQALSLPMDEVDRLPPYDHTPVHCFCVLVGNHCDAPKISTAGFCLEKEMLDLLLVKSESGGKNSQHFGNKNLVGGAQMEHGGLRASFILCEERMIQYEGVTVSWHDLMAALKGDPQIIQNHRLPE